MTDPSAAYDQENTCLEQPQASGMDSVSGSERQRQMERALDLAYNALLAHPYWCGFNKDAPGDASYNEAIRALREVRRANA